MKYNSLNEFLDYVKTRDEHQPEFLQAVEEVMTSLWPFIEKNPRYADHGLLERLVEPERAIQFRVSWVDDQGQTHVTVLSVFNTTRRLVHLKVVCVFTHR